jgi:hypothetical protein
VSAKRAAKPDKNKASHKAMPIHPATAEAKLPSKDQSRVASNTGGKPHSAAAKTSGRAASKGKKVKVADAEARK